MVAATGAFAVTSAADGSGLAGEPVTLAAALSGQPDAGRALLAESSRGSERAPLEGTLSALASVQADGQVRAVPARGGATVADVLAAAGVALGADDEVSLPLDTEVTDGVLVVVTRVAYTEVTESNQTPYDVIEQPDGALAVGVREVVTPGRPGVETVTFRVRLVDGVEASREETLRVSSAAVAEVVRVGAEPKSIARAMVAERGWGAEQFTCLDSLWTKESNWNPLAQNASSGAYGIPQSLPGSKMATVAADWRTNPATQITWGLNYIAGRYGTPCGAWAHSQSYNWY